MSTYESVGSAFFPGPIPALRKTPFAAAVASRRSLELLELWSRWRTDRSVLFVGKISFLQVGVSHNIRKEKSTGLPGTCHCQNFFLAAAAAAAATATAAAAALLNHQTLLPSLHHLMPSLKKLSSSKNCQLISTPAWHIVCSLLAVLDDAIDLASGVSRVSSELTPGKLSPTNAKERLFWRRRMGKQSQLMAVSLQAPFHSKPGMWNADDPRNTLASSASVAAQALVSYQYPPPSSGLDSASNIIPGYQPREHPQSPGRIRPDSPAHHNRGGAVDSFSAQTKRSMSTPDVHGQATADVAALALSAEKRRNKLGYHRTSVACGKYLTGHCRRRKIRCIAAPGDPHNRCSNCIRLKKECHFYAVDQQPLPDPPRRGSKAQSATDRASEESPPSTSSGQMPSEMPQTHPYPHLTMPPIQDLGDPQMRRQRTESFSPEIKSKEIFPPPPIHNFPAHPAAIASSRAYEYPPPPPHGAADWVAAETSPSTGKLKTDASQPYWAANPHESPITAAAFSPFIPNLPPQNWPPAHNGATSREQNWTIPQRSVSYSNLEGLQNQQQYQNSPYPHYSHPPQVNDHYTTKSRVLQSSAMHPPPIQTSSTVAPLEPVSATSTEPHQHAHSANPLPPVPFPNWQQPYAYHKPVGADQYPWSGPPAPPTLHPEGEDLPPPASYGYGDPANGIYYQPHHPGQ
ncbi:hypothetical protein JHW43_009435 [Diplocarpon mali]|nr:hypothetical protein JHW43_009435 [Diplocarpon mali]